MANGWPKSPAADPVLQYMFRPPERAAAGALLAQAPTIQQRHTAQFAFRPPSRPVCCPVRENLGAHFANGLDSAPLHHIGDTSKPFVN
jgi:hypothetical protein